MVIQGLAVGGLARLLPGSRACCTLSATYGYLRKTLSCLFWGDKYVAGPVGRNKEALKVEG